MVNLELIFWWNVWSSLYFLLFLYVEISNKRNMPRGSTMKTFATHTHILEILNISNNNKKALEKYGIWYKVPAALCIIIIIIKNASSSQANCERDPGRCTAGIFTHTHTWQQPLFSALYCVCHTANCPCAKWGKFSQASYLYSQRHSAPGVTRQSFDKILMSV